MTEVVVVSLQRNRDHPGKDDGTEKNATGTGFQLASQFFYRECNPCQGRIECSCNTRRTSRQDEILAAYDSCIGQESVKEVHDGRGNLN
ncbi:hypothetical protein cym2001_25890 [Pseudomonas sp. CYM-20-01]|nr:hypothetical protein cym2001_25890 [Pseudomonas sp. CYM-20-01]